MKHSLALTALLLLAPATARARDAVVILRGENLPEYDAPVDAFTSELGMAVQVFDFDGDRQRATRIAEQLREDPPPLVFALGAKAAYVAVRQLPGVPVVYAMVFDPDRYGIRGAFVTGVSMDVPADMVLSQFQLFVPSVRAIGIVVSVTSTDDVVEQAINAGRDSGYEVVVRRVSSARDVRRAFNRLRSEVDAIWLLPDAEVVTPANFTYIRNESVRSRLPLLAYSETLVRAGALMCVAPDHHTTGAQAARLAREILGGTTAGTIEPVRPEAPRVVLNRETQNAIGLKVDDVLLDFVDEVLAEPEER